MIKGSEALRTVLFLHELRDGKYGIIPRSAMDAINRFTDEYVDDLPEEKDLPMALVSAVAGWDASRRARNAMEDREAAAIARAVAAENSLARLREKGIDRFLPPQPAADNAHAWPHGCIKRSSCARHKACMYGWNGSCRHSERDIAREVEAAA